MSVCAACASGRHPHDRHTGMSPESRAGDDAGCPFLVGGNACACEVDLSPTPRPVRVVHCGTCTCREVGA